MADPPTFDWFIAAWMKSVDITQAELQRRTGWSKRKTSDLVSGRQPFNRHSLNDAARAIHATPFELLLHPEDAMQIRQLRAMVDEQARLRVAEAQAGFTAGEPSDLWAARLDRESRNSARGTGEAEKKAG